MNSSWLWNSQQRCKFLMAGASRDIPFGNFEINSLGNAISRGFQEVISTMDAMLFCWSTTN